jgi:tetratricopeptide (TPR) repeat protein
MARDAVDRSFTQMSQSPFLKGKGVERFRRAQLGNARDFYERFVHEQFDTPEVRHDLGLAHYRLAEIDRELGNYQAAAESARGAIAILSSLASAPSGLPEHRRDLAAAYVALGLIHSDTARWELADAAYLQAVAIQQRELAAHPDSPRHRYDLANTLANLGYTFGRAGRPDEMAPRLRQALDLLDKGTPDDTSDVERQSLLAKTQFNLGQIGIAKGWYDEAQAHLKEAVRLYGILARSRPDARPEDWQSLARSEASLGRAYYYGSRFGEAEAIIQQSLPTFEKLAHEHPDVPELTYDLGRCHLELATAAELAKRLDVALVRYDKAIAILDDALSKGYEAGRESAVKARIQRAISLAKRGDHARATREAEALARRDGLTGLNVYDLACVYSQSSAAAARDETLAPTDRARLNEQYTERAMEFLKQAVAMGYRRPAVMKSDHDLDALRDRDDFRKLLAGLETGETVGSHGR